MAKIRIAPVVEFRSGGLPFDGAVLWVRGVLPEDRIGIAATASPDGTQMTWDGTNVFFGGMLIGTASDGQGEAFRVAFGPGATEGAIDTLLQALTYANASDTPTAIRRLSFEMTTADGATLNGPQAPRFVAAWSPLDLIAGGIRRASGPTDQPPEGPRRI